MDKLALAKAIAVVVGMVVAVFFVVWLMVFHAYVFIGVMVLAVMVILVAGLYEEFKSE